MLFRSDIVQQQARSAEIAKGELGNELAVTRAKVADLERQVAQEVASTRLLTEENHTLSDHAASADKRIVELEGESSLAHERVVLLRAARSTAWKRPSPPPKASATASPPRSTRPTNAARPRATR